MKKLPFITGICIGIAITGTVWLVLFIVDVIRVPMLGTCLVTLEYHLTDAVTSAQVDGVVVLSNNWRALSEKEELAVLSKLPHGAFVECSSFPNIKEGKNADLEPYLILVRRNGQEVDAKIANFRRGSFPELEKWTE